MTFTGDERFFDGTETVTLYRKSSTSADGAADSIANALRQDVRARDAEGVVYVMSHLRTWHLPDANITDDPRPGDVITDADSVRWVIQEAVLHNLIGSWECQCSQERKGLT